MKNEKATVYGLDTRGAFQGIGKYLAGPAVHEFRPSTIAWTAIALEVVAYDLFCPKGETLSEGIDRWLINKRAATIGAIGVTALHLLNAFPERIDPLHQTLKLIKEH
jgi:hypothetical protein